MGNLNKKSDYIFDDRLSEVMPYSIPLVEVFEVMAKGMRDYEIRNNKSKEITEFVEAYFDMCKPCNRCVVGSIWKTIISRK